MGGGGSLLPESLVIEINELEPAILQPWEGGCWQYLQLLSTAKLLENILDLPKQAVSSTETSSHLTKAPLSSPNVNFS